MEALSNTEPPTRVLIAEDMTLVSRILASYINVQPDMEVIGEVRDGRKAVEAYDRLAPDVVLMDISMPVMDGICATREILSSDPEANVIILTAYEDGSHTILSTEAGAKSYMQKDCDPGDLMSVIRGMVVGGDGKVGVRDSEKRPGLTSREVEIVEALAGGESSKQIARKLFISERTVRNHASNIYRKLGVCDRTQAVLQAARYGVITLDSVPALR